MAIPQTVPSRLAMDRAGTTLATDQGGASPALATQIRSTSVEAEPTCHRSYLVAKRLMDLLFASVALLMVAIPLVIAMIAIRIDSPGHAIYRQRRTGTAGREFTCYKLRTMVQRNDVSAHRDYLRYLITHGDEVIATHMSDRRITRVGKVLRNLSVDELPQLVNVIRGSMSLVGPRPPIPYEVESYNSWQLRRLAVKPGITGLWQITGRNVVTFNEMCRLDLEYIARRGIFLDLKILLLTPLRAFRGAG